MGTKIRELREGGRHNGPQQATLVRIAIIRHGFVHGLSKSQIALAAGVSIDTVKRQFNLFNAEGLKRVQTKGKDMARTSTGNDASTDNTATASETGKGANRDGSAR